MAKVILDKVNKIFSGDVHAVKDVSLEIEDGELLVLVGPSGCGKSTVLRMIAGLEHATSGNISIGENIVNDLEPKHRDVAMVFQDYALYPHMTVRENLEFGLTMRKVPRPDRIKAVENAAKILGLGDLLDRKPAQLSGGQKQRVAVGRSIVREPRVFLFDEPLSNLDAKLRAEMRTEIAKLHQNLGVTTIYVTHDQIEAMTLGHRIVMMNAGTIQQIGTPLDVYNKPVNKFVAGFLGTPPMNFIEGNINTDLKVFNFSNHQIPIPAALQSTPLEQLSNVNTLGIRPENIKLKIEEFDESKIMADIVVVEPLGNREIVILKTGGIEITADVASSGNYKPGMKVQLELNSDSAHLFDSSGANLII